MQKGTPLIIIIIMLTAGMALILMLPISAVLAFCGALEPSWIYMSMRNPFWGTALIGIAVLGAGGMLTALKFRRHLRKGSTAIVSAASFQIALSLALFIFVFLPAMRV